VSAVLPNTAAPLPADAEQVPDDPGEPELLPPPAESAPPERAEVPPAVPPPLEPQDPEQKPELLAAPQPDVEGPKPAAANVFKRRDTAGEDVLLEQLASAPEVGIGRAGSQLVRRYSDRTKASMTVGGEGGLTEAAVLREVLPAVAALPLRLGPRAQLNPKAASTLGTLSRKMHDYLDAVAPVGPDGHRPSPALLEQALRRDKRGKRPEWLRPEAIPTMLQMLMHEDAPVRRLLVEILADIPAPAATVALARRAVYELDPEIRAEAVRALKGRPAADARPVFLAALRYPWAPAADHAAEALAALGDEGAVPDLVTMLKEPGPVVPRKLPRGGYVVQEVVRANHRANCLLCHAPAVTGNEPVQGVDPFNTLPAGCGSGGGGGGGGAWGGGPGGKPAGTKGGPVVIRADITFLRQDFSVQLPVARVRPLQGAVSAARYDFLVRTRRLSKTEVARLNEPPGGASYPQREAVLFALRELTGRDAGPATEDWVRLFPTAQVDVEAARLADKLVAAGPVRLAQLLGEARGGEEEVSVRGLAAALPRLKGEARDKVQEVLVGRLARLDADGLRRRLYEDAPVLRQAAVAACVCRREEGLIPDLIALREGEDPTVASHAEKGLEALTGRHFANPGAWRDWWESGKPR
jgi:hypothetical protein